MKTNPTNPSTRRAFLKNTGQIAAVSALSGVALPHVHAAGSDQLRLALIGCGGRGTGAVANAFTCTGPPKLVAMVDVFEDKMRRCYDALNRNFKEQVDVPPERKFIGFDGYKNAMDLLKPGDVAILTTPLAFRGIMFEYAIKKGLNVFMEKPVIADGPSARRMLKLYDEANKKNLKVGVGLMVRHCRGRQELKKRIEDGEIGDIIYMRAYRLGGRAAAAKANNGKMNELMFQIRRFHSFLWSSGGLFSDYNIHQIDECSWMKGSWPVKARGMGGRHFREDYVDQNFDVYAVEYTFPDGTKMTFNGRHQTGCHDEFASYAHGTKGSAIISTAAHTPGKVKTFKGHHVKRDDLIWAHPQPELNPYDLEWEDLIEAIRHDQPYNEVKRGVEASLVTSMGRFAAHTGQEVTFDEMLNHDHEFAPGVADFTMDGPAPLQADANGRYPVPEPGVKKNREY